MPDFDVCIIGAGPAGAASATLLARQGRRVALFDRARFPRDKVCGDGITPRGVRALMRLGAYPAVRALARAHSGVTIRGSHAHTFTIAFGADPPYPSDLLVVPRHTLDHVLLQHALAAGPHFFEGTKVVDVRESPEQGCEIVTQDGSTVTANIVIVATGAQTQLLRGTGLLPEKPAVEHAARVYFEGVKGLDQNVTLFFDGVDMPGYGWIFPVSDTAANIGCGVFDQRRAKQASRLRQLIATHPLLQEMLEGATQIGPIQAYPLRTDFAPIRAGSSRKLCVGEAAGLVNPITGEGIDYALESAEFVAAAFEQHWRGAATNPQRLLFAYRSLLARRFGRRFRLYRWIQRNCLGAAQTGTFLRDVEHSVALRRMVVDGLFGRAKPRDLLRPSIWVPAVRIALKARALNASTNAR